MVSRLSNKIIVIGSVLAIVAACVAFGVLGTSRFVTSLLSSPVVVTERMLDGTSPQSLPLFNVRIVGDDIMDSGLYEETGSRTNSRVTAYFSILAVGDSMILVKTPQPINERVIEYAGVITNITEDDVAYDVYTNIIQEVPSVNGLLVPLLMTTDYPLTNGFIILSVEVSLLIIGIAGLLFVWLIRNRHEHTEDFGKSKSMPLR